MGEQRITPKDRAALRFLQARLAAGGPAPSVREIQAHLGYRSPRSAAIILERLAQAGFVRRRADGQLQLLRPLSDQRTHARTVPVPLVGSVPCGAPLLAEENVQGLIQVSTSLARPPHRYFLLRATGDSMELAGIQDGDLVLVRQQPVAESGEKVVALIDDEATLKVFRRKPNVVALVPRSKNKKHKPILLSDDFQVQGVVVATIPNLEKE